MTTRHRRSVHSAARAEIRDRHRKCILQNAVRLWRGWRKRLEVSQTIDEAEHCCRMSIHQPLRTVRNRPEYRLHLQNFVILGGPGTTALALQYVTRARARVMIASAQDRRTKRVRSGYLAEVCYTSIINWCASREAKCTKVQSPRSCETGSKRTS